MNRKILISLLLLTGLPAGAHEITCAHENLVRHISVVHEIEGEEVPCMVKYDKPGEGGTTEFPWNASNQAGYCEEKADYLAERLTSFGWSCVSAEEE